MSRILVAIVVSLLWATPPLAAQNSGDFNDIVVFGDSLSDQGDLSAATLGLIPGAPYFNGRFSDGPVWVETVAAGLGLATMANGADFSVLNGNNHAFASARVERTQNLFFFSIPSVRLQISSYLAAVAAPPGAETLYVVSGGGNDIRDALNPGFALGGLTQLQHVAFVAEELASGVQDLVDGGARYVLVANSPDIGITPESLIVNNNAALATVLSDHFQVELSLHLDVIRATEDVCIVELDFYGLTQDIFDDALNQGGATYGLTNGTTPIFAGFAGSPGASPAISLFSDDLHPSAVAHVITADEALATMAEVMLPGSNEDFDFELRVDGLRPPAACAAYAAPGQTLALTFLSPGGSEVGSVTTLLGQAFPVGVPPASPLAFPELHVNQFGAVSLGVFGVFTNGTTLNVPVMPGLSGTHLHLQAIVSSANAANGFFLASDAWHLVLL